MNVVFVVNHARDWPFEIEGARVVSAREYLTDPAWSDVQSARIVNLCRTDRYQGRVAWVLPALAIIIWFRIRADRSPARSLESVRPGPAD